MNKVVIALVLILSPALAFAAGGGVPLEKVKIDLQDKDAMRRGAEYFVDHCMGCHSLQFQRYNRMGQDLGIPESEIRQTFIRDEGRPGDLMTISMRPDDAEEWFGTAIPDLTLVTRWRSPAWVYTYLKSYYLDPSRPWGVNNAVFADVGMPHVLAPQQGLQKAVYKEAKDGEEHGPLKGLELVEQGSMTPEAYDEMVYDITAFLTYVGEPIAETRRQLGVYVLLFLGLLFVVAYALKKEYWKDIH